MKKINIVIFPIICIVISVILLIVTLTYSIYSSGIIKNGIKQKAIVTDVQEKQNYIDEGIPTTSYDIYVKYKIDNEWYNSKLTNNPYSLNINDEIDIFYDSNNYEKIFTKEENIYSWIIVLIPIVLLILSIRSLIINIPKKKLK